VNCNFDGCTLIQLDQSSNQQIIFTNCVNMPSINEAKCSILGLNLIATIPRVDTLIGNFNGASFGGVNCNIDPLSEKGFVVSGGGNLGSFKAIDATLNSVSYGISPFGYFSLSVDDVCLIKVPIMDVKIADYKRIYLIEFTSNSTMMMSESGEIAVYPGSISNFTEDRWKNARKIPIPVGYSIQTTIFPNATLPSVPTTAPPTTTPVRTSAAATTPAPTTTRPPVPTTTTPVPTIAATTLAPSTITPAPTIAATTPAMTTKAVAPTTPFVMVPSSTSVTYSNIDNKTTNSASYSKAYNTLTYNL
jgi:hypothetical protein